MNAFRNCNAANYETYLVCIKSHVQNESKATFFYILLDWFADNLKDVSSVQDGSSGLVTLTDAQRSRYVELGWL